MKKSPNLTQTRPWGMWEVLDEGDGSAKYSNDAYKVKKLTIEPGQSISYQTHDHRTETWVIIRGSGILILDDHPKLISDGDVFTIKKDQKHQVINVSHKNPLLAIEVQRGNRCDEIDIKRIER